MLQQIHRFFYLFQQRVAVSVQLLVSFCITHRHPETVLRFSGQVLEHQNNLLNVVQVVDKSRHDLVVGIHQSLVLEQVACLALVVCKFDKGDFAKFIRYSGNFPAAHNDRLFLHCLTVDKDDFLLIPHLIVDHIVAVCVLQIVCAHKGNRFFANVHRVVKSCALVRFQSCHLKHTVAVHPVFQPGCPCVGRIDSQPREHLCVLVPQGVVDLLGQFLILADGEHRRIGQYIGVFLDGQNLMPVGGNAVICRAQRVLPNTL